MSVGNLCFDYINVKHRCGQELYSKVQAASVTSRVA